MPLLNDDLLKFFSHDCVAVGLSVSRMSLG